MVKIKDKPLITNALDVLAGTGRIDEVVIVCGHMADKIRAGIGNSYQGMNIKYIVNTNYETTNNVYSLYMVRNEITNDCLLLECDLYYKEDIIKAVIGNKADCSILVSPYNKDTMNGTVIGAEGINARELIISAHQDAGKDYSNTYKTVNIYKFKESFFNRKLMPALKNYIETGNLQSYYELVLGSLIYYRNDDIQIVIVDEKRWFEIDDMQDYEKANQSEL